jgi:hypothetical protein
VKGQRGSASLVVASALGLAAILSVLSADLARVAKARVRAQTAADAAALAAAQELLVPTAMSPAEAAADYASQHGASVAECRCERGSEEARVRVELVISLPFLEGDRTISAEARAVVEPSEMAGLDAAFVARLGCLFAKVPGLSIVSGFRTHAEQAALFEEKPGLAAPPGHSLHEVGLAADLGYPSEKAREMAHRSASSCGLEFPMSYEPWHVEPLGIDA